MRRTKPAHRFAPMVQTLEGRVVLSSLTIPASTGTAVAAASTWDAPATALGRFEPGQTYKGLPGGLYAGASNEPSPELAAATDSAASRIVPLDRRGRPSEAGRIGVVTIGQSTTEQWFSTFIPTARAKREAIRSGVFFVNGGQSGQVSTMWAISGSPWAQLSRRVGAGRSQVQVAFLDAALIQSERIGHPQEQARVYSGQLSAIIARAKREFPNLRMVYVFPFHWSGSAPPQRVVTEPGSYELHFGIRRLILQQSLSDPVVVWGPDVWSQTQDAALYSDGLHWSRAGRVAMTELTWRFLETDPAAAQWLWRQA